jgi:hypothetical protein
MPSDEMKLLQLSTTILLIVFQIRRLTASHGRYSTSGILNIVE